ncbi:MAG: dihydroorotase [Muribaculaceae bacterium]|nr:dihydroorotase [Muribaculaceae bacterium]
MDILIKGGEIFGEDRRLRKADVYISDGIIARIAEVIDSEELGGDVAVIDADGLTLIPGLTDMHVHFREPGFEYKETIAGGASAARAGGFTTVCTMPNLNPAPDTLENLNRQLDAIELQEDVQILPFATITRNRIGEETLADYDELKEYVAGYSDDGSGVQSADVMRAAMKRIAETGKILAAHCEVNELLRGGYIHDGDYARYNNHRGICSESEWREIERDIELAEQTGVRLHICHISTAEGVDLVRKAKRRGLPVTCETAPHYLWFSDADLENNGRWKMNPPIRSDFDRSALLKGIQDGTIDAIATDHAPHAENEKNKDLQHSAMGVVGLETAFPAAYTRLVLQGRITFDRLVDLMSLNPRRLLGLKGFESGGIAEGDPAMLTLVNLNESRRVNPDSFHGKGRATPFEGLLLTGWPVMTICNFNKNN